MKKILLMLAIIMCPSIHTVDKTIIPIRKVIVGSSNYSNIKTEKKKEKFIDIGMFEITAYCPCSSCCGKTDCLTSTGTYATEGRTIAVDPRKIPYGSVVVIEGLGEFIAEDCGGAINGNRIDLFLLSHKRCLEFGRKKCKAFIKEDN